MTLNVRHKIMASMLALVAGGSSICRAGDTPEARREALRQQQTLYEQSIRDLPTISASSFDEIFKLRVEANRLVLTTPIKASPSYASLRAELKGVSGAAIVICTQLSHDVASEIQFEYIQHDSPDPDTLGQMHVLSRPQSLEIDKTWQTVEGVRRVMLMQTDDHAQLAAFINRAGGGAPESLIIAEKDFTTLRRLHPVETERWLRPLFRQVRQIAAFAPDSATVWQILGFELPVEPSLTQAVSAELSNLDSADFRVRLAAADRLKQLGRPIGQAIMGMDRRALSPEQNLRLDEVVASFKIIPDSEASALRNDRQYLLDCLSCEDATLRKLSLQRLQKVVGQPLSFEEDASPEQRAASIDRLRTRITQTAAPPPPQ